MLREPVSYRWDLKVCQVSVFCYINFEIKNGIKLARKVLWGRVASDCEWGTGYVNAFIKPVHMYSVS